MTRPTSSPRVQIVLIDGGIRDRNPVRNVLRETVPECHLLDISSQERWKDTLRADPPDLVVADAPVRWSTSVEIVRAAKARWPTTPVIMVAAVGSDTVAADARQVGADSYFEAVPEDLVQLPAAVRAAVGHTRGSLPGAPLPTQLPSADLAALLERVADPILIVDSSGSILFANGAAERSLGCDQAPIRGQSVTVVPDERGCSMPPFERWRHLGDGGRWRGIVVRSLSNRSEGLSAEISPILDGAGGVTGFLVLGRAVGGERQSDLQRRQAQTMDAIARFSAGVAHAYNNFLMTIMGYTELLRDQLADSAGALSELADIKASCDEATVFTRQLLTFGRKQGRQSGLVDLHQVLAGVAGRFRQILGTPVTAEGISSAYPALVRIDRERLEQVLADLAGYIDDVRSADMVRITVATRGASAAAESDGQIRDRSWVEVQVVFAGPRLDADAQARIFEPSFPKERKGQRIDLRLATLYAMIRQHDGRVTFAGSPDGLSTLTISLPMVEGEGERATG